MTQLSIYEKQPANPRAAVMQLRELLEKQKGEIAKVLPTHLDAKRLARLVVTAVSQDKKLMECSTMSVLCAVMQAAALGLEPHNGLGDCFIVGYRNRKAGTTEAQLVIGYRGLIALARRSGQILSIEAHVVRAKDKWSFRRDQDGTFFSHVPSEDDDPGEVSRAYAVARLRDTPLPAIEIMSKRELDAIKRGTQSKGEYGPWLENESEMQRKSCVRRLSKYLPLSVEFADALDREDRAEDGKPISADDVIDIPVEDIVETPAHVVAPKSEPTLPPAQKRETVPAKDSNPLPDWADIPPPTTSKVAKTKPTSLDSLVKPPKGKIDEPKVEAPKTEAPPAVPANCEECGAETGRAHHPACPNNEGTPEPDLSGGEIQGRDPGQAD